MSKSLENYLLNSIGVYDKNHREIFDKDIVQIKIGNNIKKFVVCLGSNWPIAKNPNNSKYIYFYLENLKNGKRYFAASNSDKKNQFQLIEVIDKIPG